MKLNADGTIEIELDGSTILLKRPKLRQYRAYVEDLARTREKLSAEYEAAQAAQEAGEETAIKVTRGNDMMLDWLNVVLHGNDEADGLAPSAPVLTEDNAEVWMTMPGVSNSMVAHWTTIPKAPGAP